jgi:predicted MFS family arabinose efflux permease
MQPLPGKYRQPGVARRLALCACNAALYAGISGLIGLMPVYLGRAGLDPSRTGLWLALLYVCLATGTVGGGTLCHRFRRRQLLLIASGALAAPVTWAIARGPSVTASLVLLGGVWFATGVALTTISVLTGLSATPGQSGSRFGALTLSAALGLLLGSCGSGPLVDRWGFAGLFTAFGWLYLLIPLAGLLVDDHGVVRAGRAGAAPTAGRGVLAESSVAVLLIASVLAQAANIMLFLSRALIMHARGFDATAISTASAVGSLVSLPLPLVLGSLADRVGRGPLLLACFVAPALGLIVQVMAVEVWQFWVASVLSTIVGMSVVVASAHIADVVPEDRLSWPLAALNATPWVGIVLGLSAGGAAINAFQMQPALLLALVPAVIAIVLLVPTATLCRPLSDTAGSAPPSRAASPAAPVSGA